MPEMNQSAPRYSENDLEGQAAELAHDFAGTLVRAIEPFRQGRVFYAEGLCVDWTPTSPTGIPGHITCLINDITVENIIFNRPRIERKDVFGRWCRVLIAPQRILFDDIIPQVRES